MKATVQWERLSRDHNPAPTVVEVQLPTADGIALAIWRDVKGRLVSRDVEVSVDLETRKVTVYAGFQVGGTGSLTLEGVDASA